MVRFVHYDRLAPVFDVVAVGIFVAIGRSAHDHGVQPSGLASTSWPFLVGLIIGWFVVVQRRWTVSSVRAGVIVWLFTVALGMVLRVIAGQGTAIAFVIVAFAFLGLFIVGWRVLRHGLARRRR